MALTKASWVAAVAVAVAVCLAVAVEAQQPNTSCFALLPAFQTDCSLDATAACCDMMKSATETQVSCFCDVFGNNKNNPYGNITQPLLVNIFKQCSLPNKLSCNGAGSGTGAANKVSSKGVIALLGSLVLMSFY